MLSKQVQEKLRSRLWILTCERHVISQFELQFCASCFINSQGDEICGFENSLLHEPAYSYARQITDMLLLMDPLSFAKVLLKSFFPKVP